MSELIHTVVVQCPYCWAQVDLLIDRTVDHQEYVEDCSVCCQPIVVTATAAGDDSVHVDVRAEND